jgi:hypothetical protein
VCAALEHLLFVLGDLPILGLLFRGFLFLAGRRPVELVSMTSLGTSAR